MKIAVIGLPGLTPGKRSIKDARLDQVDKFVNAKKKTYIQVELVAQDAAMEADAIMVSRDGFMDLILKDLEFVETRLSRAASDQERALLNKLKTALENEKCIFGLGLSEEEKKALVSYSLLTIRPVVTCTEEESENPDALLARAVKDAGYISFFTAGEKETRAWLIRKGETAWEASGAIHSDIQKGFIRAEIISFDDYVQSGGETAAKQAGKLRLEQKDYVMQDTDLVNFRFNR